jgi:hypothetical protein
MGRAASNRGLFLLALSIRLAFGFALGGLGLRHRGLHLSLAAASIRRPPSLLRQVSSVRKGCRYAAMYLLGLRPRTGCREGLFDETSVSRQKGTAIHGRPPCGAIPSRPPRLRNSPRGWAPKARLITEVSGQESDGEARRNVLPTATRPSGGVHPVGDILSRGRRRLCCDEAKAVAPGWAPTTSGHRTVSGGCAYRRGATTQAAGGLRLATGRGER